MPGCALSREGADKQVIIHLGICCANAGLEVSARGVDDVIIRLRKAPNGWCEWTKHIHA